MMEREGIEMAGTFEMAGPVVGRRACIHEDQAGVAAMFREPSRVN
jgi:hypothetical protein